MRLEKLINLLELSRVALVFTVISNSWLMVFLAYAVEPASRQNASFAGADGWPLGVALMLAAIVAAGLHTYGMALNDVLDARHDRVFSPQRPIAAGRMGSTGAVVVAVLCLLAAVCAAVFLGTYSILLCLLAAAGILFYDAMGKFLPAAGIVTIGLLRAVNMFIANPSLGFAWPVLLTMTHVMVCSALAYRLLGKRPRLRGVEWWGLCAGWAFWSLALVGWMLRRETWWLSAHPNVWLGPLIAMALFVVAAWWVLHGHSRPLRSRRAAGAAFMRLALLWLILYDASWLLSCGSYWQGATLLVLFGAAVLVIQLLRSLQQWAQPAPAFQLRSSPKGNC